MKNTLIKIIFFLFLYNSVNAQITNGLTARYSFNNGTANDGVGTVNGIMNNALFDTMMETKVIRLQEI